MSKCEGLIYQIPKQNKKENDLSISMSNLSISKENKETKLIDIQGIEMKEEVNHSSIISEEKKAQQLLISRLRQKWYVFDTFLLESLIDNIHLFLGIVTAL